MASNEPVQVPIIQADRDLAADIYTGDPYRRLDEAYHTCLRAGDYDQTDELVQQLARHRTLSQADGRVEPTERQLEAGRQAWWIAIASDDPGSAMLAAYRAIVGAER